MRNAWIGLALAAMMAVVVFGSVFLWRSSAEAQQPAAPRAVPGGDLTTLVVNGLEGRQHVVVIDPRTRVMCAYHIDGASGEIALRSVRQIGFDMQMEEYNVGNPSPREIRSLLSPR